MRTFLNLCLRVLIAVFPKPFWNFAMGKREPSPLMEALGKLLMSGFAVFAAYNLYVLASSGLVLQLRRRKSDVWLSYDDDPVAFLLWSGIYTVAAAIPVLMILGRFAWKRRARRIALRQFREGSGPPPVIRPMKDP